MVRTGRPRSFDRDQAIAKAMHLFWQQGYEATSLDQLKRCMGNLSTASFYAAFGSKEKLYRAALDRYLDTHGQVTGSLYDDTLGPREAIERALRGSARMQTDGTHPLGCMLVTSASGGSEASEPLQVLAAGKRAENRAAISNRIQQAIDAGDLPRKISAEGLATMYEAMLLGFSVQARDGVSTASLENATSSAILIWQLLNNISARP